MSKQKDIKRTYTKYPPAQVEQNNFTDVKTLVNKPIYEFANKKTEKLVTALYMVSDCMEVKDSIRDKLRLLGVELLSDIFKLSRLSPMDNSSQIDLSLSRVYEIFSLLEIAHTLGYISEMNTAILKMEFNILVEELKAHKSEEKHFPFNLNEKMFEITKNDLSQGNPFGHVLNIKDMSKRTRSMSLRKSMSDRNSVLKHSLTAEDYKKIKSERVEKILSVIKNKNNSSKINGGATIKDIAGAITNCSEKTIQRELLILIDKGQIKKTGAKRWSKYQIFQKPQISPKSQKSQKSQK